MKNRAAALFALLLSGIFFSSKIVRADDATDQMLASIETAVKSNKASPKEIHEWISLMSSDDTPISIKERAAWGLGFVGGKDKATVPALLKAAEHKGLLVRSAAVHSLIRLHTKQALGTLEHVAQHDPILSLRHDATLGLGLLASDKSINTLVALASDPTPEVRGATALAMSSLQSKKNDFTQAIQQMESDENPYVQSHAKDALILAQRKNTQVQKLLLSQEQDIRLFSAVYFIRHGATTDLKAVESALDGEADDDVRNTLSDAKAAIKKRSSGTTPIKKSSTKKKATHHSKKATTAK